MSLSSSYDPTENKLRLYSSTRLDAETYARVKAAGFRWAPKSDCFFAPAWSPEREDLLLDLCGEIGDEDTTLVDRAAVRAERFEEYRDKRGSEAEQARGAVQHLMDGIPLGQPILVGHSSERHARKDAERIESGMRKAVNLWKTSQYWQQRAKGALRHAKYKERPDVRARRIKTLEAELRKCQRSKADGEKSMANWQKYGHSEKNAKDIANYDHVSQCFPLADYPREPPASQYEGAMGLWSALDGGVITALQAQAIALTAHTRSIAIAERWIEHLNNRLTYERTLLQDAGGTEADQTTPEVGGAVRCWVSRNGGWSYIQKVNKVSITVLDTWNDGGKPFTRTIPMTDLKGLMSKATVDRLREEGRIVEQAQGLGFFRADSPPTPATPQPSVPDTAAYTAMQEQLKSGIQVAVVDQLFPTPSELADRMAQLADIQPGERVLEPSAGTGNLAQSAYEYTDNIVCLDIAAAAVNHLRAQGYTAQCQDFLTVTPAEIPNVDVVLMNPPFSHETEHVTHALQFVRPGGRLVAIMSNAVTFRKDKKYQAVRALLESHNATIDPLPAETFKDSGTSVNTVLVSLRLPPAVPVYPPCAGCGRVRVVPPQTQCMRCEGFRQNPDTKLWEKPSVPDVLRRQPGHAEPLLSQALGLSSGTLATCTGLRAYAELDAIRADFVRWCDAHPMYATWQDAWQIFWAAHLPETCPWPYVTPETGQPSVPVATLETLAAHMEDAGKQEATRRQTERMTKELCSKKQSPKVQHAPGGLFAKEQLKLF